MALAFEWCQTSIRAWGAKQYIHRASTDRRRALADLHDRSRSERPGFNGRNRIRTPPRFRRKRGGKHFRRRRIRRSWDRFCLVCPPRQRSHHTLRHRLRRSPGRGCVHTPDAPRSRIRLADRGRRSPHSHRRHTSQPKPHRPGPRPRDRSVGRPPPRSPRWHPRDGQCRKPQARVSPAPPHPTPRRPPTPPHTRTRPTPPPTDPHSSPRPHPSGTDSPSRSRRDPTPADAGPKGGQGGSRPRSFTSTIGRDDPAHFFPGPFALLWGGPHH
jgi:hypothetical protein